MNIGEQIKEWRIRMGLTQKELAEKSGLSKSYVSELESNKRNISLNTLENVCANLGMELEVKITMPEPKKADNEFYQSDDFSF